MMGRCAFAIAALGLALSTSAQSDSSETVHSVVIFTRHGEQTPLILPEQNKLTPLGAQQLFAAGSDIRQRYILADASASSGNDTAQNDTGFTTEPILGISPFSLDNSQISALSTTDEYVVNSAQAFFQGLYPPTNSSAIDTYVSSLSQLANSSNINNPLGGYQYAQIETAAPSSSDAIWISGDATCPEYSVSGADYYTTPDFVDTDIASRDLYKSLEKVLGGRLGQFIAPQGFSYFNAETLFDYINYEYNHNVTVNRAVSASTLAQIGSLASQQARATNANLTASGATTGDRIRAISGLTLAGKVLGFLTDNVASEGYIEKMNLMFGGYEPFTAFFALSKLANPDSGEAFYDIPDYGSSMAFQLFSPGNDTGNYPSEDELYVRFLFRNGTGEDAELTPYPIFGRGHSETDMSWSDFKTEMTAISISSVGDWCNVCQSEAIFCAAYGSNDTYWNTSGSDSLSGSTRTSSDVSPTVAGVIGAAVTIGVLMIALAVAMLLGGVRFRRVRRKRRSDLGGFKGAEKLASDADLPTKGDPAGAPAAESAGERGHERVGSWELNDRVSPGLKPMTPPRAASAYPDHDEHLDSSIDPFGDPVRVRDSV